jgi:predicted metalloprotease with PDZ domain
MPRSTSAALLAVLCLCLLALATVPADGASAQDRPVNTTDPIAYRVDLTDPQTQMVGISMMVPMLGRDEVDLVLPSWRPGRYEILDPAGTVREVTASGPRGRELPIRKVAKDRWRVTELDGAAFTVRYRVYANSIRDRTRHADDTHAFLSPSSCFMFIPEERGRRIVVTAQAPRGWRMATGLPQRPGERGLPSIPVMARDYDELVDSPLEIGLQDVLDFEVDGIPHEIVIWPPNVERHDENLIADFRAIVESSRDIFGRLPYQRYVFLIHVGVGGGGTEHVNSTIMQTSEAAMRGSADRSRSYRGLLGLTAHEFFHTWNVKQFRPAGIKPYDYERENYTDLLWVAEGSTSYYDELLPVRAGITKPDDLLDALGGQIRSTRSRPGRRLQSVAESSFDAWVKYNQRTPDDVNCTISFYTKGSMVSFLLDMEVRRLTAGARDLDDVMATLFERFPLDAAGYTTADLRAILTDLTGDDFEAFFAAYVDGVEPLPLEDAVRTIGLELVLKTSDDAAADAPDRNEDGHPDRHWIGVDLRDDGGRTVVRSVRSDGPAYHAGLNAGDEIVALDGQRIAAGELDDFLQRFAARSRAARTAAAEAGNRAPDGRLRVTYFRRDQLREMMLSPTILPDARWVLQRRDDATEAERLAYADWCGQPWPGTESLAGGGDPGDPARATE